MNPEALSEHTLQFLSGGGEMGELTRAKDWSITPVGPTETWPQSLRTTLGIILNSKFPMFLWWGPELTCFYNDAYRPSLGQNGKHPAILGMTAREAWPEIWEIIKPLIDQVLSGGEATWSEDQLLPIFRNGKIEDVYWTFGYSPVHNEAGKVAGVLVTCTETTGKVNTLKYLEESNRRYFSHIMQAPVAMCIFMGKDHRVKIANDRMLELMGKTSDEVINSPVFEALPETKGQGLEELLDTVYRSGEKITATERPIDLFRNGRIETIFVDFVCEALHEADGTISGIVAVATDVSSKVTVRHKVEESQERLNIVINASELGIWELNLKTGNITYSDRYLEIIGMQPGSQPTHEELIARIHPDDIATREKALKEAYKTGTLHYETRIIRADGSVHWVEGKGKVSFDEDQVPFLIIGTARDITEEKSVQEKILQREQRFRLLADSMPQFVWTSDAEGNLNYFNHAVYRFTGLTEQQLKNGNMTEVLLREEREEYIRLWNQSISSGKDFTFEHRIRHRDGEYRWQLSRAIPQRDASGNIHMWVGTTTDIQEQKMLEKELEKNILKRTRELELLNDELIRSEQRYHLMISEVQDYAIFFLNNEGIVENWNKGAQKIKGYEASEIIGKSFSVFYTDKDRENNVPKRLLGRAIREGKAKDEGLRVRKDKSIFWASVVITAIHDEANNVIGFSKVTHDLTEKKRAEDRLKLYAAKLEEKNRELEKMNGELQSFAYISSHDLQEPLRKIQTFASRIQEKESDTLSENGKDYFNRMKEAARRMQTLIQDLLSYSRTSTSERVFIDTDLNELIKELKADFKEAMQEKNAAIVTGNMCRIKVIPFQIRQLLENLVSNALKFSDPSVPPVIHIESELKEGSGLQNPSLSAGIYCHLSVSDNGIGFDPQYKERIFEVFQRLHGKTEYSGTGIGLAIVKKIVENHNGLIEASSKPGEGARFDIYLPVS
ncbi:MAG: sensor signal transduction histidine kinase [Bacteroidetes bacterium]|jgi:PAS domain S-box-containing protein|nr:sensor signal transduction histidine kinase [Bacteroidota bacterium]